VGALRRPHIAGPRFARVQQVLEHKFYFDELYDAAFYRPAVSVARALGRWIESPLVFGSVRELSEGIRGLGLDTSKLQTGPRPHLRARDRRERRRRHRRLRGGR
jgi:NADH:ubiquinone oxidoreductase subunit 5 (subunit L)/multisubunit Na+/H+ antiporter MnhA subunit